MPQVQFADPRYFNAFGPLSEGITQGVNLGGRLADLAYQEGVRREEIARRPLRRELEDLNLEQARLRNEIARRTPVALESEVGIVEVPRGMGDITDPETGAVIGQGPLATADIFEQFTEQVYNPATRQVEQRVRRGKPLERAEQIAAREAEAAVALESARIRADQQERLARQLQLAEQAEARRAAEAPVKVETANVRLQLERQRLQDAGYSRRLLQDENGQAVEVMVNPTTGDMRVLQTGLKPISRGGDPVMERLVQMEQAAEAAKRGVTPAAAPAANAFNWSPPAGSAPTRTGASPAPAPAAITLNMDAFSSGPGGTTIAEETISIPRPRTKAEYDALESGAVYIGLDGEQYRKP